MRNACDVSQSLIEAEATVLAIGDGEPIVGVGDCLDCGRWSSALIDCSCPLCRAHFGREVSQVVGGE